MSDAQCNVSNWDKERIMATKDGKKTGGGSRKGVPNKATADIKAMINNALTLAGGEDYLLRLIRQELLKVY